MKGDGGVLLDVGIAREESIAIDNMGECSKMLSVLQEGAGNKLSDAAVKNWLDDAFRKFVIGEDEDDDEGGNEKGGENNDTGEARQMTADEERVVDLMIRLKTTE